MIVGIGGEHSDSSTVQVRIGEDDTMVDPQGTFWSVFLFSLSVIVIFRSWFPCWVLLMGSLVSGSEFILLGQPVLAGERRSGDMGGDPVLRGSRYCHQEC